MSIINILFFLLALFLFSASLCQRRIKNGQTTSDNKRYAVYFLKAHMDSGQNHGWTCGGAIVTQNFIITSAACLEDIQHMYVIAGYKKFVVSPKVEEDECTKNTKRKVILICVPKDYILDYYKTETWSYLDIAVAKVDKPYGPDNEVFETFCSYAPIRIPVNFKERFQEPGVDVLALGWGHPEKYEKRQRNSTNLELIHYAATQILDKDTCLTYFGNNKAMEPVIKTSLICTMEAGNLNDKGDIIKQITKLSEGCITWEQKRLGMEGTVCDGEYDSDDGTSEKVFDDKTMRERRNKTLSRNNAEINTDDYFMKKAAETPGICQNDHGGPLVTWIGTHEVLIGVASLYNVDTDLKCIGPYLFTSTYYTRDFLKCILLMENDLLRLQSCHNQPFQLVQRRISWPDDKSQRQKYSMMSEDLKQRAMHNAVPSW